MSQQAVAAILWRYFGRAEALVGLALLGFATIAGALDFAALPPDSLAAAIDARKSQMVSSERSLEGLTAEPSLVIAWTLRGKIEKIEVEGLAERAHILYDFYWRGSRLVAARERTVDYGVEITGDPIDGPERDSVAVDDYLELNGGKLARWWRGGKAQSVTDTSAVYASKALPSWARTFRRLMVTPEPRAGSLCDWSCSGNEVSECRRFRCEPR